MQVLVLVVDLNLHVSGLIRDPWLAFLTFMVLVLLKVSEQFALHMLLVDLVESGGTGAIEPTFGWPDK